MTDKEPIVARFTPHSDGAFLRGVPQKDLTQRDIDNLNPIDRRDAFAPHPLYGKPLYTLTDAADRGLHAMAKPPKVTEPDEQPKWYRDKLAKAQTKGFILPARNPDETQKEFDARVDENGVAILNSDGSPANDLGEHVVGFANAGQNPSNDAGDGDTNQDGEA